MSLHRIGLIALALQLMLATGAPAQVPPPFVPPTPHFNSIDPHPPVGMPLAPEVPVSPGLSSGSGFIGTEPVSGGPIYTLPSDAEHKRRKTKVAQKTKNAHRYRHQPESPTLLDDGVPKIMQ